VVEERAVDEIVVLDTGTGPGELRQVGVFLGGDRGEELLPRIEEEYLAAQA
jgi:hypothetical protein